MRGGLVRTAPLCGPSSATSKAAETEREREREREPRAASVAEDFRRRLSAAVIRCRQSSFIRDRPTARAAAKLRLIDQRKLLRAAAAAIGLHL